MARTLGLRIEGVGFDTARAGGAVFCDTSSPPTSATYEWVNALVRPPGAFSVRVNPFTGSWSAPGFSFALSRSSRIARALLGTQLTASYALASDHSTSTTTITFTSAPGLAAGTVVYAGDEAIKLGTPSGAAYTGCTRGFWGTQAVEHLADDGVYVRLPYLSARLVTVIEHRGGVEEEVWRAMITRARQVDGQIELECESVLAIQARQRLNKAAQNYLVARSTVSAPTQSARDYAWTVKQGDRARRQTLLDASRTRSGTSYLETFDFGGRLLCVVHGTGENAGVYPVYDPVARAQLDPSVALNATGAPSSILKGDEESIYRVLLIHREADQATIARTTLGADAGDPDLKGVSATYDLYDGTPATANYPYHPLAIALALLTSTGTGANGAWDVLGAQWGLGLSWVDVATFEEALEASPGAAIDHLLLGAGGEEVNPYEVIKELLLRPYGYSLTLADDGSLSVCRVKLPSLYDRAGAAARELEAYPDSRVEQDLQLDARPRTIVATTGLEPFSGESRTQINVLNTALRPARVDDEASVDLDLRVLDPARLFAEGRLSEAGAALTQALFVGLEGTPLVRFRCASWRDAGLTGFRVGEFVKISSLTIEGAWWVDADGEEVQLDADSVQGYGLLTGVTLPFDKSYMDIEALMIAYRLGDFVLLRAPSGRVTAWDGVDTLTLDNDAFGPDDAATFTAGDEVTLWASDGTLKSTLPIVVDSTGSGEVVLLGDPGATPAAGDILRVDRSDVFDNQALFSGVKRPFAFIGNDPTGTFEDVDGATVSNHYGTEVLGGFGVDTLSAPGFTTLDDEAIEPEDAQSAWPLDAWLQHTLEDNESTILTREIHASGATLAYGGGDLTTGDTIRPFASVSRMTIATVPLWIAQGTGELRVRGLVRVCGYVEDGVIAYADTLDLVPELTLEVFTAAGGSPPFNLSLSGNPIAQSSSSEQWVEFEITATLDRPSPYGFQGYVVLSFTAPKIPAGAGEEVLQESTENVLSRDGCAILVGATLGADTSATTRPAFDDQTMVAWQYFDESDPAADQDGWYDTLLNEAYFSTNRLFVGPSQITGGATQLAKRQLLACQFRGLEWVVRSYDTSRRLAGALDALRPVLGEDCAPHALRVEQAYRLPRLLHVGPDPDLGAGYPAGYPARWPRATANAGATPVGITQRALVYLDDAVSSLRVSGLLLPSFCALTVNADEPENIHDAEQIMFAPWDITASVHRGQSGGWSSAIASASVNALTLRHWYTYLRSQGALVSEYAHYAGEFPLKEGSLYLRDLKYLYPFQLQLDVDVPLGELLMVRLEVKNPDGFAASDVTVEGSGYTIAEDADNLDRFQLALCGWTIQQEF